MKPGKGAVGSGGIPEELAELALSYPRLYRIKHSYMRVICDYQPLASKVVAQKTMTSLDYQWMMHVRG